MPNHLGLFVIVYNHDNGNKSFFKQYESDGTACFSDNQMMVFRHRIETQSMLADLFELTGYALEIKEIKQL